MSAMTGTVEELSQKDVTTKFGVKPTFSFKCNGGWVKCGFKKPPCNVGDVVSFDGETGTYGLEGKNIVVTVKASGPAVSSSAPPTPYKPSGYSGAGSRVFPIPALHGDRSIVRQNALARATELYIACRGGKPFDLDADSLIVVIKLARGLEAYTAGDIDRQEAEAAVVAETAATAPTATA